MQHMPHEKLNVVFCKLCIIIIIRVLQTLYSVQINNGEEFQTCGLNTAV